MRVCIDIIISVDPRDNMIDLHFLVIVLFLTRLTLSSPKTLYKMPLERYKQLFEDAIFEMLPDYKEGEV